MSVAVADIKTAFLRRIELQAADIEDAAVTAWVNSAALFYSRYHPITKKAEYTITTYMESVDLPEDCIFVKSVLYKDLLGGIPETISFSEPSFRRRPPRNRDFYRVEDPSFLWRQVDTVLEFISPVEDSGTLVVTYTAHHVATGTPEVYTTIPTADLEPLAMLTQAEYLENVAINYAATPDTTTGSDKITSSLVLKNTLAAVAALRRRAVARYSGPVGVLG